MIVDILPKNKSEKKIKLKACHFTVKLCICVFVLRDYDSIIKRNKTSCIVIIKIFAFLSRYIKRV